MDYAFAPAAEFEHLRLVLTRRPKTTLISEAGVTTIADFLNHLRAHSLKAGDLIIGSHGTDEGQLFIALDQAQLAKSDPTEGPQTVFETLQQHNTITIPASVKSPDTSVRLFGCLLGSNDCLPFLTLLKQRFGNPKSVSASRYVHTTHSIDGDNFFEFMRYDFRIFRKQRITTLDKLVEEFKKAQLHFEIDNTPVPDANWGTWLPQNKKQEVEATLASSKPEEETRLDLAVKLSPPAGDLTTLYVEMAAFKTVLEQWSDSAIPMNRPIPTDETGLIGFVKEALGKDRGFGALGPNNLYPIYTRYHLSSLDTFVGAWNWRVEKGAAAGTVNVFGTRFRYDVLIPVTKSGASDELMYNYYPETGGAKINFAEDNSKLFGVV